MGHDKLFLDDMFKILIGTTKQLHKLFKNMNKIHPTLKFTMNHTTPAEEPHIYVSANKKNLFHSLIKV